jgi:hypothetical protein
MPTKPKAVSLGDMEKLESKQFPLDQVPEEFDGSIQSSEIRDDARGNRCLFVEVAINGDEEKVFTQKYTPTIVSEFREAITKLDYDSLPGSDDMLHWKRYNLPGSKVQFDRWYPTARAQVA